MGRIPFDLLIRGFEPTSQTDWVKPAFDYVLNEYAVYYNYSATVHFSSLYENASVALSCGGFAPSFEQENSRNLSPLQFNQPQLEDLETLVNGWFYYGSDASEEQFKAEVNQYGIINLSTHAFTDSVHWNSYLAFTENRDPAEDDYLYAYEIYNLDLEAQMAVLAACETGTGEIEAGEGSMSLARAFAYAGCPSVVMSLWKVDDASTSFIIRAFFEALLQGVPKAEALRLAKKRYLEQSRAAGEDFPFNWGALVVNGHPDALEFQRPQSSKWPFLLVLAGIISLRWIIDLVSNP